MSVSREPILKTATVISIVAAVIGLLVAFGVPLTNDQREAIMGLVAVVAPFVVWAISRQYTTTLDDPRDDTGQKLVRESDGFDAVKD